MTPRLQPIREVAGLFLKLGFTAFGGPAAHTAMMHTEVVEKRRWLNDQEFLDLLGATNLIPGPNSTEMAIHIGLLRAGWAGLIVGGACFIGPAMFMVMLLAWAYVEYGRLPAAQGLLYGIKPVVVTIIVQALWTLGRRSAKTPFLAAAGLLILAVYLAFHLNEILLLLGGGLAIALIENARRLTDRASFRSSWPALAISASSVSASAAAAFSLPLLFLTFLKIGSILYGSGYVLFAFLRADFVERLRWLTDQQLLDAIAVGQITPGPLFTSATFVGYLLAGIPGGLVATLGIFLPSFLFVAASNPLIPRLRQSVWVGSFLDGVNVASLSLMAAVTFHLAQASLVDWPTIVMALVSLGLLLRFRINSTWLIAAGAVAGLVLGKLGW